MGNKQIGLFQSVLYWFKVYFFVTCHNILKGLTATWEQHLDFVCAYMIRSLYANLTSLAQHTIHSVSQAF